MSFSRALFVVGCLCVNCCWIATALAHAASNAGTIVSARLPVLTAGIVSESCLPLQSRQPPDVNPLVRMQAGLANIPASQIPDVLSEPFVNPRGQNGFRHRWQPLADQEQLAVEWTSIINNELFGGAQIITEDRRGPQEFWLLDSDCVVRDHRRIAYRDGKARAILVFDTSQVQNHVQNILALNPELPRVSVSTSNKHGDTTVRVALVDSGVNYLIPGIRERLAVGPDGSLLGVDFWDQDKLPFDAHPSRSAFHVSRHGTRTASLLLREALFVELVPYRYPRPDMSRMRKLVEHAASHGVSIVGLPLGGNRLSEWQVFEQVAAEHPNMLFIASAGNNGRNIDQSPVYPASLNLDNMLVVTSADDFALPAEGVNWGYESVDYLLPAEGQPVLDFDGSKTIASGSSYAVPRLVALAAHLKKDNPDWYADDIIQEIARRFASGTHVRYVNQGYIPDPQPSPTIVIRSVQSFLPEVPADAHTVSFSTALDVLVLDDRWLMKSVAEAVQQAATILNQCNVVFNDVRIKQIDAPAYLRDLSTGPAKTLMDAVRASGMDKRITIVFARDTKMQDAYDGEAFGRGNTRHRAWLQDSVWLTLPVADPGIALAHELFHVLVNSGEHVTTAGNLMQAYTSSEHVELNSTQCERMQTGSSLLVDSVAR